MMEEIKKMDKSKQVIIDGVEYVPKATKQSQPLKQNREYIFVVDNSGSVPLQQILDTTHYLIKGYRGISGDLFNVINFNLNAIFECPKPLTYNKINEALKSIKNWGTSSSGSNLEEALKFIDEIPVEKSYTRILIIITDGFLAWG